jgi:dipeptidyl aminopeptidase/acylaminoacyl peptidase
MTLPEARAGFQTKLHQPKRDGDRVPQPPAAVFRVVGYDAPGGKLSAYLSPSPKDGRKHPAIIWIKGGDCNTINEGCWKEGPPANDQSASAFRKAGIPTMFPSLRGGNDNPGVQEGFFGEVDDVIAAHDFLATQDFVDPERIYLGGHSTGGTLVMLVAESTDRFRATFSFGPADDVAGYGPEYIPFDASNRREFELRAPVLWLHGIKSPTVVFEGTRQGNLDALQALSRASSNPQVHFHAIEGGTHFSILAPTTRLVAAKILQDNGPTCNIAFTAQELNKAFAR